MFKRYFFFLQLIVPDLEGLKDSALRRLFFFTANAFILQLHLEELQFLCQHCLVLAKLSLFFLELENLLLYGVI